MRRIMIALATAAILGLTLAGCGDYWEGQGAAVRDRAQASLARAQADRESASAAVIEAEGRAALAESQAEAIDSLARANGETLGAALELAQRDPARSDHALAILSLALAAMSVTALAAVAMTVIHRAPAPAPAPPPAIDIEPTRARLRIETPEGVIEVLQDPLETRYMFLLRCRQMAELLGGGRLLGPGR